MGCSDVAPLKLHTSLPPRWLLLLLLYPPSPPLLPPPPPPLVLLLLSLLFSFCSPPPQERCDAQIASETDLQERIKIGVLVCDQYVYYTDTQ